MLTDNGRVLTWGCGSNGQLGNGARPTSQKLPVLAIPIGGVDSGASASRHDSVGGGAASAAAATEADASASSAGAGSGRGRGRGGGSTDRPHSDAVVRLAAGADHCLALTARGSVYSWGSNSHGQLGNNSNTDNAVPSPVHCPRIDGRVSQIVAGWEHSMAVTLDGALYTWGNSYDGHKPVTGHGHSDDVLLPTRVMTLAHQKVVHAACGWDHCLCITSNGAVHAWGSDDFGMLGVDEEVSSDGPVSSPAPVTRGGLAGVKVAAVDGGRKHTVALDTDGYMWVWGEVPGGAHGPNAKGGGEPIMVKQPTRLAPQVDRAGQAALFCNVVCGDNLTLLIRAEVAPSVPILLPARMAGLLSAPHAVKQLSDGRLAPYPSSPLILIQQYPKTTKPASITRCGLFQCSF